MGSMAEASTASEEWEFLYGPPPVVCAATLAFEREKHKLRNLRIPAPPRVPDPRPSEPEQKTVIKPPRERHVQDTCSIPTFGKCLPWGPAGKRGSQSSRNNGKGKGGGHDGGKGGWQEDSWAQPPLPVAPPPPASSTQPPLPVSCPQQTDTAAYNAEYYGESPWQGSYQYSEWWDATSGFYDGEYYQEYQSPDAEWYQYAADSTFPTGSTQETITSQSPVSKHKTLITSQSPVQKKVEAKDKTETTERQSLKSPLRRSLGAATCQVFQLSPGKPGVQEEESSCDSDCSSVTEKLASLHSYSSSPEHLTDIFSNTDKIINESIVSKSMDVLPPFNPASLATPCRMIPTPGKSYTVPRPSKDSTAKWFHSKSPKAKPLGSIRNLIDDE